MHDDLDGRESSPEQKNTAADQPTNTAAQESGAQANSAYASYESNTRPPYGQNGYSGTAQQPYYGYSNGAQPPFGQNGYGGSAQPHYGYYGGTPQPPKQTPPAVSHHKKRGLKILIAAVAMCVVVSLVVLAVSLLHRTDKGQKIDPSEAPSALIDETPTAARTDADGELTPVGVYEAVKESSVGILVYADSAFSNTALAGQGSGVILGEDASGTYTYIVTCAHVISGGGTIKVQLVDESQYDATVVGYDSHTDIGVLRIRKTGLKAAQLGNSDTLSVGETVYAIGNPGGVQFAGSFTDGMVSAISRPINSEIGYEQRCIQHTAAINPGNSGGALVNAYGQVIGINSSKIANTSYEGMGFAVPSVTVKEVFDEIVANGYVTNRPKLGINYFPASSNQMYSMIVGANNLPAGTLVIQSINSDSELVNTNVQQGDMIIAVNGKELESTDTLPDLIQNSKVGDTLTLTICHVDTKNNYAVNQFDVQVTLVEDKGTSTAAESSTQSNYYNPFGAYGYGN